ncbi:uncharacterized protein THITE_2123471 [Thermothielavioides terrestris NRRL 8126]|uniref:[histone H3]-trimethyl-L-lysine(9) demethylase n=1 Tax=Thermothielavioides terrestris (strain ATCC 38088 / NRRL 8126) TaxID=578455 RepID=G2RHF5_THETT|nr:uncharacterized protein THITE_2123471 [Thermothielavioides terrestris NRRL 8126]AEO71267.1 hypothetical protein THITE_2123471 [Thermothielavioides terrestris NRRL 8126]
MSIEAIGASAPMAVDVDMPSDSSKPIGLHSPPDSNNAMDVDGSDSELSDLDEVAGKLDGVLKAELEEELKDPPAPEPAPPPEDIGEILPDHWSGNVPVFKPTMKQFQDFKLFMEKVDKYGMKSGIIKIIPPQEWKDALPPLDNLVKQIRVRDPIKQDIMGSNGTYRQVNILHQRSYNLPQWRQLCEQSEHQPPARRGERRANSDRKPATRSRAAAQPSASARSAPSAAPAKKRRGGRVTRRSARTAKDETEEPEDRPMTPVSPNPEREEVLDSVENDPGVPEEQCEDEGDAPVVRRMGFSKQSNPKTQSTSARRKYIRREGSAMIDEAAFKDFDYRMDVSEFTPERCEELEKIYWKTLTYAPPLYGADLPGTLFDESTKIWNLNKLPNLLDVLGTKVPGVNTAYLYLGMWKATFAWHLEDVDLYSINYLHFGAPKQWYSISQADARRFEAAMKNIWPTEAKACDQFLRHKSFLISPSHLKQHYNITVNKCVSYPGEFVVTYPYGYHSGYNLGYNCAEAVNFALDSWLPMGKIAKRCQCAQAQDSVWIDVYEIERKLRGEETEYEETEDEDEEDEEDEEDQDTGLPSPPSSHTVRVKVPGRKRKRAADEKEPRAKKKIRLRLKSHVEPPCCLCPNDIPGAEILPTDDGRKAHRMCALYLPETYLETVDDKEIVANVAGIDKARLELKCLYCRSKKGACFQCSQKKCPRSYHATCAAAAGVFVESAEVPVFGEDGTEYKEQAFEFSCRFHRTKRDRKLDGEALEKDTHLREAARALKMHDICQLQYYRGDIFAGVVVENRPDEETVLVDVIPNGDRVEVEWKWLLLPDPADFRLPKASANAIPMPTSRKAQKAINAKRAVDEAPRKDDEFATGFVWAEFHTGDPGKNPEQVKVDFSKENQIWYYLGKTSTEAKAQYTEDLSRPWYNPKGNFLDTIPKPVAPAAVRMPAGPPSMPVLPGGYPTHPSVTVVSPGAQAPKQEKPYVYKPRKPIAPTSGAQSPVFTSQMFAVNGPSASASPLLHQQSPPQQMQPQPPPQPVFQHHHVFQHPPQQQQVVHHQLPQPPPYQIPLKVKQYQPSGSNTQRKHSSALYSSDRFAPVGGQSVQPPSRAWSSPSGAAGGSMPHPPPMTSSALRPPSFGDQPSGAAGPISAYQKYSYFQVHHNRDSSRYRTPYAYGQGGGFTNGYEGNHREFLIKTQKALSGGSGQSPVRQVPASLLKPLQPRPNAPPTPSAASYGPHASAYAQILPRPATNGQPSPSPQTPAAASSPFQASSPYQSPGFAPQTAPAGQSYEGSPSGSVPLHPAIRPQYGASPTQHASQPMHNVWPPVSQPPAPSPPQPAPAATQPKPPPAKHSHSPIPLPPYVRQMAAPLQSSARPPVPAAAGQQAALPSPSEAPPTNGTSTATPIAQTNHAHSPQGGQWPPPGDATVHPTQTLRWSPQEGAPAPSPTAQQPPASQAWPQPAQPFQTPQVQQPMALVQQQAAAASPDVSGQDNAALLEKMMMNLRRASQNFGRTEEVMAPAQS